MNQQSTIDRELWIWNIESNMFHVPHETEVLEGDTVRVLCNKQMKNASVWRGNPRPFGSVCNMCSLKVKPKTTVLNVYHGKQSDVYIGRAGHGQDGYFGNIHPVGNPCPKCKATHTQEEAVEAYRADFLVRIEKDPVFKKKVLELCGKTLGCFCKPKQCHGDVLAEYVNTHDDPYKDKK
jgi:hypothetical protein